MSEVLTDPWMAGWLAAVSSDKELSHIGKLSRLVLKLTAGERTAIVFFDRGAFKEEKCLPGDDVDIVDINGSVKAWEQLLKPMPDPLLNDLLAMDKNHPDFSIVSDRVYLLRHLRLILKLFSIAPRQE